MARQAALADGGPDADHPGGGAGTNRYHGPTNVYGRPMTCRTDPAACPQCPLTSPPEQTTAEKSLTGPEFAGPAAGRKRAGVVSIARVRARRRRPKRRSDGGRPGDQRRLPVRCEPVHQLLIGTREPFRTALRTVGEDVSDLRWPLGQNQQARHLELRGARQTTLTDRGYRVCDADGAARSDDDRRSCGHEERRVVIGEGRQPL